MLPRLDEHAPPRAWGSQIFIRPRTNEIRPGTARYRPSAGAQPPSARPLSITKALNPQIQSLAQSRATESTLIARAGVYRSARLWARWNRAALPLRVFPLKLGYPARKRVVWASGRKRLRVGCPRRLVALRSLWGGLGTAPGPSLGGRRPRWRSAAPEVWGPLLGFDVAPPLRDPWRRAASACSRGRLEATAAVLTGAASIRTMKRLLRVFSAPHPPGTSKTPWPHRAPAA